MANFSREWTEDVVLPDGSTASSVADIERWLKRNGLALASDYSDDFRRNVRYNQEKAQRAECFADFIRNYKRLIWK